jgi:hypothetical protein
MTCTRFRNYEDEASEVVAQLKQREASLIETIQGIGGFVASHVLDTWNGGVASISVYETRAAAEESIRPNRSPYKSVGVATGLVLAAARNGGIGTHIDL